MESRFALQYRLKRSDGSLIDSRFTIHYGATWTEITISSSGGSPDEVINSEYTEGLEAILQRLASAHATLIGVILNSGPQTEQAISERIVGLDTYQYPVLLNSVEEIPALRAAITRHSSRTLSGSQSGGNPRRRISLLVVAGVKNSLLAEGDLVTLLQAELA